MDTSIDMSDAARNACVEALSRVLADTYVLYLKTHSYHWNVVGPKFCALHDMFEKHYRDLWESLDEIAERIRALGHHAPNTCAKFHALATVKENERVSGSQDMLRELIADTHTITKTIRAALATIREADDEASAGLLAERLAVLEKQIWMMKSMLG